MVWGVLPCETMKAIKPLKIVEYDIRLTCYRAELM